MKASQEKQATAPLSCGLVMPISATAECPAAHWVDVKNILMEAVGLTELFQFTTNLVSDGDDAGLIHKRIVQNLHDCHVVVCDVSCKNPNVMFELGMRLAFDKPTVIVSDDLTGYSFDTGVIEHIQYRRDLRYADTVAFKQRLAEKIDATYKASLEPNANTFLKSFGKFKVASLVEEKVSGQEAMMDMLNDIRHEIAILKRTTGSTTLSLEQLLTQPDSGFTPWSSNAGAISSYPARLGASTARTPASVAAKHGIGGLMSPRSTPEGDDQK